MPTTAMEQVADARVSSTSIMKIVSKFKGWRRCADHSIRESGRRLNRLGQLGLRGVNGGPMDWGGPGGGMLGRLGGSPEINNLFGFF